MLLLILGYIYLFEIVFSSSLDIYPGVELLDCMVVLFLVLLKNFHAVFEQKHFYSFVCMCGKLLS